MNWLVIVVVIGVVGIISVVMDAVGQMHKRSLAHAERMMELNNEAIRLQAGSGNYLPSPSDTIVRRGPEE